MNILRLKGDKAAHYYGIITGGGSVSEAVVGMFLGDDDIVAFASQGGYFIEGSFDSADAAHRFLRKQVGTLSEPFPFEGAIPTLDEPRGLNPDTAIKRMEGMPPNTRFTIVLFHDECPNPQWAAQELREYAQADPSAKFLYGVDGDNIHIWRKRNHSLCITPVPDMSNFGRRDD